MVDPFTMTITKLYELGFFKFLLPFMFTAAVFYGLLRKSRIFGEPERNVVVNAIVGLTAAFMVWSYPVIAGVDVQLYLTQFFMQATIASLAIIVGLLMVSMFAPPDLPEYLKTTIGKRFGIILIAFVLVGTVVLLSSGLVNVFFPPTVVGAMPSDVLLVVGVVIILAITIILVVGIGRGKT